ncbi:hypothetical protein ACIGCK_00310 [Microbacterium sp. NPDC078428]|uniref:hypothetical protein n=1 Tax=Microbacterium sp. NPDC078428 TaxID=3364190 RepID=UPI0037CA02AE
MDFGELFANYWWLIFPVMAMAGGIGGAWQKALERRHVRRLEVLRAKSELRAASQAPAGAVSPDRATRVDDSPAARLQRLFEAHDAVTARWLEYELDVAKLIAFPAMSDGRQPLTAAFLRAKRTADGFRPASAKARISKDDFADYRNAVHEYEAAFDIAERDARRLRDRSFTEAERKRLDTAKQLLTVAVDQAATPAERQLAYRRVREELDGLISVSDEAIDVLEKRVALELTSAAEPPDPGAAGAGAAGAMSEPADGAREPGAPRAPASEEASPSAEDPPVRRRTGPGTPPPPGRITRPRG